MYFESKIVGKIPSKSEICNFVPLSSKMSTTGCPYHYVIWRKKRFLILFYSIQKPNIFIPISQHFKLLIRISSIYIQFHPGPTFLRRFLTIKVNIIRSRQPSIRNFYSTKFSPTLKSSCCLENLAYAMVASWPPTDLVVIRSLTIYLSSAIIQSGSQIARNNFYEWVAQSYTKCD